MFGYKLTDKGHMVVGYILHTIIMVAFFIFGFTLPFFYALCLEMYIICTYSFSTFVIKEELDMPAEDAPRHWFVWMIGLIFVWIWAALLIIGVPLKELIPELYEKDERKKKEKIYIRKSVSDKYEELVQYVDDMFYDNESIEAKHGR